MKALPHISDVISQVRAEVASQEKVAAVTEKAPTHNSVLGTALTKCASLLRQRANQTVTYDDVFAVGNKLLGRS